MRALLPLLLSALLAACSSTGPIHPPSELQPIADEVKVQSLWGFNTSVSYRDKIYDHLQPVLRDGLIYTVSAMGVVRASKLENGVKYWRHEMDTPFSAGLTATDELLFLGTPNAELIALSRADGEIRWRVRVSSEVLAPVAVSDNIIIVRSADGVTQALKLESGEEIWRYSSPLPALSLRGDAAPVIVDGLVLLGLANGRLSALSLYDGVVRWETSIVVAQGRTDLERMVDVDATPLVVGDVIYVAAHQGRVVALSKQNGNLLWSRDLGASDGLAVDAQNLYLADDDGQVWALDRNTGATIWTQDKLKYRDLSAPAAGDEVVVVGDFEGYLHWLSKIDGAIIARHQVDEDGVRIAPLVLDGVFYSRSKSGKVEALRLKH